MCDQDEFRRIIIKQGEGLPTIPASADHRNGDWLETDVYESEWYHDILTGKVYIRTLTGVSTALGDPATLAVELDLSQIGSLDTTPVLAFSAPAGYGARFTREPYCIFDSDGTPFISASGESIQIHNSLSVGDATFLAKWTDVMIQTDGAWRSETFFGFRIVTGDVEIMSTVNIAGGGTNAKMTFYFDYELVPL